MAKEYNPQLAEMGAKIVARREEPGMTATELTIVGYAPFSIAKKLRPFMRFIITRFFCKIS